METKNTKIEYRSQKRSYVRRDLMMLVVIATFVAILFSIGLSYFMLISFIVDLLMICLIIAFLSMMLNENLFRMIISHMKKK